MNTTPNMVEERAGWTPGPWVINDLAGPTEISTADPFEDIGCAYADGRKDAQAIANARLMAAAPDLYEIVARFVAASENQGWISTLYGDAVKALSKAEFKS